MRIGFLVSPIILFYGYERNKKLMQLLPALISNHRFINKDGKIAVEVLNTSDDKKSYHLWMNGDAATVGSLPHPIATLIIE